MTLRRLALAVSAVVLGVLPLVACGSDRTGVTTAPSSALSTPLSAAALEPPVASSGASVSASETPSNTITSLVAGTSCPTLQFTIGTYLIKTDSATRYDGGSCATLQAGTKITLQTTRLGGDREQTVYASQITIRPDTTTTPTPTPIPTNPTTPVQTDVTMTGVTGTCPDVTFTVGTYTFKVSSSTGYSGGTCADLKAGVKVSVVGTKRESDSVIVVMGIGIKRTDAPTGPTGPTTVSGEGIVSSLVATTSCPALTFVVGGSYTVVASASTHWEHGTCATLKIGSKVELTGTRTGDSSIAATKIEFRDGRVPPTDPTRSTEPTRPTEHVEGEGVITSLGAGAACPTLQFSIGTHLVKVDASTLFDHGDCRDLAIGKRVHVKGALTGDGTVLATRISVQSDSPGSPVAEGDGKVSRLVPGTACPALTFLIEEYTVTLTASTTFVGGSCGDVAAGKKLGVKGTVTGEKQVLATQIVFRNGGN